MSKLTKDELINRINDLPIDDEMKIALMEDVTDSVDGEVISAEDKVKISSYDELKLKYEDIVQKYKNRFMSGNENEESEIIEPDEELEEKEIIDIKEI